MTSSITFHAARQLLTLGSVVLLLAATQPSFAQSIATDDPARIVAGPDYTIDPDLTDRGNPQGQLFEFTMAIGPGSIYPGTDSTLDPAKEVRSERSIHVYVPAAYADGTLAPIMVTLDGPSQLDLVRNAVDNLSNSADASRMLPAFITIAVQNGGGNAQSSERGLEYDTISDRHARFINDEVLPAVLANPAIRAAYPNIAFTSDPWGKAVMGCSSGGRPPSPWAGSGPTCSAA